MAMRRAFRILLSHAEGGFRLASAAHVEKITPPSGPVDGPPPGAEAWIALEDVHHRVLYRRPVANPLGRREVFTGDVRDFQRVRLPSPDVPSLLVPDLPGADRIVLYASETEGAPARPVFTASIREVAALAARQGGRHGCQ